MMNLQDRRLGNSREREREIEDLSRSKRDLQAVLRHEEYVTRSSLMFAKEVGQQSPAQVPQLEDTLRSTERVRKRLQTFGLTPHPMSS